MLTKVGERRLEIRVVYLYTSSGQICVQQSGNVVLTLSQTTMPLVLDRNTEKSAMWLPKKSAKARFSSKIAMIAILLFAYLTLFTEMFSHFLYLTRCTLTLFHEMFSYFIAVSASEQEMVEKLFTSYNKYVRPTTNFNEPTNVTIYLTLLQLIR